MRTLRAALVAILVAVAVVTPVMSASAAHVAHHRDSWLHNDRARPTAPGCVRHWWSFWRRDCKDRDAYRRVASLPLSARGAQTGLLAVLGPYARGHQNATAAALAQTLDGLNSANGDQVRCVRKRTLKGITWMHEHNMDAQKLLRVLEVTDRALNRIDAMSSRRRNALVYGRAQRWAARIHAHLPDLGHPVLQFAAAQAESAHLLGTAAARIAERQRAAAVATETLDCVV